MFQLQVELFWLNDYIERGLSVFIYRQYVGKADFLVFRAMDQHGFLGQLQEKKLVSHQC